jgi:hypothetical protein
MVRKSDGTKEALGWEQFVPYWEAWQVRQGQRVTTYAQNGDANDDEFANASYSAGSKGFVTEAGSAQFYSGLALPNSFAPHNVDPAGILPSTNANPGGLAGGTGAIDHNLTATWDSSNGDNTTKLQTT